MTALRVRSASSVLKMVFKLGNEAAAGRDVLRPFVENAANVRRQRNSAQQMFGEEALAFRYIGLRDGAAGGCQVEVTVTQFGKTPSSDSFRQGERDPRR